MKKALFDLMTLPKPEAQDLGTYIRSITILPILVQLDLFSLIHSFFSVSLMEHEPKKDGLKCGELSILVPHHSLFRKRLY